MNSRRAVSPASWLTLTAAVVLLAVSNGRWHIPVAAWLAPALLLRFVLAERTRVALAMAWTGQVAAYCVAWWGIIPAPGAWYWVAAAGYATLYLIPIALQRQAWSWRPGCRRTLVLPLAWVSVEWFVATVVPYGSWTWLGYTQSENLPLLQLTAVTGLAGVSFVVVWWASVANELWEQRHEGWARLRRGWPYFALLFAVLAFGQVRLAVVIEQPPTLRVAALTPSRLLTRDLSELLAQSGSGEVPAPGMAAIELASARLSDDLLARSREEAAAGAAVVVWAEHAARVTPSGQRELIGRAAEIAVAHSSVLVLGIGLWDPDGEPRFDNRLVVVGAAGTVVAEYSKARPIVGRESAIIGPGGSPPALFDVGAARVAIAICHDLDFTELIRQVGRAGAELLLAPSSDWEAITPLHAEMAAIRSIENGCALVRPCSTGLSLATDALGRTIARRLDAADGGSAMIAHVPIGRRSVLYPWLGEAFALASLLVLGLAQVSSAARRARAGQPTG